MLWVKVIQLQGRTATCHVNTMGTKVLICDLSIQPTVCQRSDSRVALEMCLAVFVFNPSIICTVHPFAHQFVKLDTYRHVYPPLPVFMPMSRSITSLYHIFYIWLRYNSIDFLHSRDLSSTHHKPCHRRCRTHMNQSVFHFHPTTTSPIRSLFHFTQSVSLIHSTDQFILWSHRHITPLMLLFNITG